MARGWRIGLTFGMCCAALCWAMLACGERPAEDPRAQERSAALAYGKAAAPAARLQAAFLDVWQSGLSCEDLFEIRRRGRERVLPALGIYLAALEQMPCDTPRLHELHTGLKAAWGEFQQAVDRYYARVSEDNLARRNARLQDAWARLGARIVAYRKELAGYYTGLGLTIPAANDG